MSYSGMEYLIYKRFPCFLQNLFVSHTGSKRWRHEFSDQFQTMLQKLVDLQWFSKESIYEYQKNRLTKVLLAAKKTEFYSEILPAENEILLNPFGILQSIPVLDKNAVREEFNSFTNPSYKGKLIQHGTSGTTGTPLQVFWTPECIDYERALIWRQRQVTGFSFGYEWRGMFGAHQIVPIDQKKPPFWRVNCKAKQVYFSTYHISIETAPYYYEAFSKFNILALEGYPSAFYAIATSLNRNNLSFPLKGIYYGAEPLHSFQREVIEKVFSCYIWDYYGLTERVASASEFECKNGLHENWENCILEIVDTSGSIVPEGHHGELIGTSLSNFGFPLLRYRTGDMTRFIPGECNCGRHSRRIARIDTKREDLLLMPDGSLLSASNLTYPFKEVENILESQLFQETPELLLVKIVPAPGYSDSDGAKLKKGLSQLIPESVDLVIKCVQEIPRTKTGKYRFCISKITGKQEN